METFIKFYGKNSRKPDVVYEYFLQTTRSFYFKNLQDIFFGILNGNEFVGEGFVFMREKDNQDDNLFIYSFSEVNGVIVRVCLCYFLMPTTVNDLFTILSFMKEKHLQLYKSWEKAYELRKKVNIQTISIEL